MVGMIGRWPVREREVRLRVPGSHISRAVTRESPRSRYAVPRASRCRSLTGETYQVDVPGRSGTPVPVPLSLGLVGR